MGKKFNPRVEAGKFLRNFNFIFEYETVFEYKGGFYQKCQDRKLMDRIAVQLDNETDNSRMGKVREVLEAAKNTLSTDKVNLNPNPLIINSKNGLLDVSTMTLSPHPPPVWIDTPTFIYQVNAKYNPEAKCPTFWKFLEDILVNERDNNQPDAELITLVQQFLGYCLYLEIPFHKALTLYGEGSNGKSLLISVVERLLRGFVSHVHFESIGRDMFATSDLAGKLLNISPEISANAKLSDSEVKAIISGDQIRGQRKHQKAFDFKPFAKHIISTNNLPRADDKSFGFFRRFIVIPFHVAFLFPNERKTIQEFTAKRKPFKLADPFLEKKLFQELDGIFQWAIKGLQELLDKKDFAYSRQAEEMAERLKARSSTVEAFADKHLDTSDVTAKTPLQDGYQEYVKFCQRLRFPVESSRQFPDQLRKLGHTVKPGTNNSNYIYGARLV